MSSRFTLVPAAFATLAALAVPRAAVADTFCGVGLQYLVALRCGEGGPVVLQCVPDALRGDICTLPHTVFAEAICRQETGESVEPSLVQAATGATSTWHVEPVNRPAYSQARPLTNHTPHTGCTHQFTCWDKLLRCQRHLQSQTGFSMLPCSRLLLHHRLPLRRPRGRHPR